MARGALCGAVIRSRLVNTPAEAQNGGRTPGESGRRPGPDGASGTAGRGSLRAGADGYRLGAAGCAT
ncbi:hypothetical protein KCH_43840 [Kitasatospora cheerisanensis KCTC 2395]|uniref:Uncharacterized protein n=1 Tax=Kitasatospora cheerisanensis KCTC 2395 TaxID=1348663 RepID=A0A066Z0R6_9ACTN|nr:hypothetical protein KCH_43840 [Kitasatospora cheerisanensis KCTC 2395]